MNLTILHAKTTIFGPRGLIIALAIGLAFLLAIGRKLDRAQTFGSENIGIEGAMTLRENEMILPEFMVRSGMWVAHSSHPDISRLIINNVRAHSKLSLPVAGKLSTPLRITWQPARGAEGGESIVTMRSSNWQFLPLPEFAHSGGKVRIEVTLGNSSEELHIGQPVFTDPLHGQTARTAGRLAFWLLTFLWIALLATVVAGVLAWLSPGLADNNRPLASLFGLAAIGYLTFWAYFIHPRMGDGVVSLLAVAVFAWFWSRGEEVKALWRDQRWWRVWVAMLGFGFLYFGFVSAWNNDGPWSWQTASRYSHGLPVDNVLPQLFAERLLAGESPRNFFGDWLSSDRPPLQAGWILLLGPVLRSSGFTSDSLSQGMGFWFQFIWLPALAGFFQLLGVGLRQSLTLVLAVGLTGFVLLHTQFVWPKMAAASFLLGGWVFLGGRPSIEARCGELVLGGLGLALGFLSHGAAAFAILGLIPTWMWSRRAVRWRAIAIVMLVASVVCVPWAAYQRFYDPPGNRLIKWHLAGMIAPNTRGTWNALCHAYHEKSWTDLWNIRLSNLKCVFIGGDWNQLVDYSSAQRGGRRADDFFHLFHAMGWWNLGLFALPFAWWRTAGRGRPSTAGTTTRVLAPTVLWIAATLAIWILLMFEPDSAVIHQGSYLPPLLLLGLGVWSLYSIHPGAMLVVSMVAALYFATTFGFAPDGFDEGFAGVSFVIAIVGALAFWAASRETNAPHG